ncbi:MAG: TIM barrel protein [Chloroflexi bacterium]|nr:TIM barrel protein [Chloroflexota bacterium]
MRFGIMEMQVEYLVPVGQLQGSVTAYVSAFDHANLVMRLASQGFNVIELGGDLAMFFGEAFDRATIERLKALKEKNGLSFTVHLPLWSVEPSTPLLPVRQGSVRAVADIIRATLPLEPEVYVLHAYGALASEFFRMRLAETARALILQQFQLGAMASIKTILAETGIPSRQLAVETVEFPFEMTLALAEQLDLSMCFDTGHVLSGFSGPVEFFDALERCLPRLAEVHLHDSPLQTDQTKIEYGKDHQPLGTGDLDLARLLDRLQAANFGGPIIFELTVPQAIASRDVIRQIR